MPISRAQLLFNFKLAQLKLEQAKKDELRWRILVAQTFDTVVIGTNTSDDGLVKMIARVNVTLDKDKSKITATMCKFAKEFANELNENLITWDYKLSVPEYNNLSEAAKIALADIITITPGTPSVTLI